MTSQAHESSPNVGHRFLLDEDSASDRSINLNSDDDESVSLRSRRSTKPDLEEVWTPDTSVAPSLSSPQYDPNPPSTPKPPPTQTPSQIGTRPSSTVTTSSTFSKARPESLIFSSSSSDPLVLGVCLVDFDHLVGPRVEYYTSTCQSSVFQDEEITKILPFLALPDGAHSREEDYAIFHLVHPPAGPYARTVFGISCTRQIATSDLTNPPTNATRGTVQKAVVVLTSRPLFTVIRDKLGVVTKALFLQRDFGELSILREFEASLESVVSAVGTESGLVFGLNVRELLGRFRHRALILLKALILQKRIMFTGHPVERLCTYQYTLVSLIPALLQSLTDCGSPPLQSHGQQLLKQGRPSELRTSDRKSMLRYLGLPLDLFGKDAFFQPYLPLQQMDMLAVAPSWLCGSTNEMVWSKAGSDIRVDTENAVISFTNPNLERVLSLTPADRKWMDEILQGVVGGVSTNEDAGEFKGSDDWAREKFEEYISAFLASVRYRDFVESKGGNQTSAGGDMDGGSSMMAINSFNPLFMAEFKKTPAHEVWQRCTDEMLFDIVEARHPTPAPPTIAGDIGLRLQEGMIDLKLDQQLAPAKQALGTASAGIGRAVEVGSTGFFKAVEGVRGRWNARTPSPMPSDAKQDMTLKEVLEEDETSPEVVAKSPSHKEPTTATTTPASTAFSRFSLPFSRNRTTSVSSSASAVSPADPNVASTDRTDNPSIANAHQPQKPSVSSWGSWGAKWSFGRTPSGGSVAPPSSPPSQAQTVTMSPANEQVSVGLALSPKLSSVIGSGRGIGLGNTSATNSPRSLAGSLPSTPPPPAAPVVEPRRTPTPEGKAEPTVTEPAVTVSDPSTEMVDVDIMAPPTALHPVTPPQIGAPLVTSPTESEAGHEWKKRLDGGDSIAKTLPLDDGAGKPTSPTSIAALRQKFGG